MKLGNAPCSWGVEFEGNPLNPGWKRVLDECSQAGFRGIDLGPVGFFPEDQPLLRDALSARHLELSSAVVFRPFHDPSAAKDCRDATIRTCKSLAAQGAKQLVLIDSIALERTRTIGRPDLAPCLDADQWRGFVARIRDAALIATEEFGLTASIHAHAGGYCDFEEEHDRLLNEIDEKLLKICVDVAHASLAGMDPFALTRRYASRLAHVHLKDLNPAMKAAVVRDGIEFYEACANDLFCQMGSGQVDFAAFKFLLDEVGYDGWCTVEQDCAPDSTASRADVAQANRSYLTSVGF